MSPETVSTKNSPSHPQHPFRRAVLRGLAVVLPPLLTIVVFIWAWSLISGYVLRPVENVAAWALIRWEWDVRRDRPGVVEIERYRQITTGEWIPRHVYDEVNANPGTERPHTAYAYYRRYVRIEYLKPWIVIPAFLVAFISALYFLGRFLAAGMGRWMWASCEALIHRLPIIRNVYSSVKQVTDFVFSEQAIEFNRVVAVEYPRKGIWSVGFVTGESMLDIQSAANEPVLSVLMPTSPMPMTGFTITVRKSETVDLDLTIDQAIQFVVSCGVVIPPHQLFRGENRSRVSADVFARLKPTSADSDSTSLDRPPRNIDERSRPEKANSLPQEATEPRNGV